MANDEPSAKAGPRSVQLGKRLIGPDHPVYVIAEISGNHGQDFDRAIELVRTAKAVGADAVKLQTYTAATITLDVDTEPFRVKTGTVWEGKLLYELYEEASTPWDWQPKLKAEADALGIDLFSTPFDETAVEFLETLDPPAYKVASFELTDHELVRAIAAKGRPMIVSTGMASLAEIDAVVGVVREAGAPGLVLLRCNSAYPARPAEMDLLTIPHMVRTWGAPVGLSDHTLTPTAAVAAVVLGACVIEKHITLDRGEPGPDSSFSLEPDEFRTTVEAVREAEAVTGAVRYGPSLAEVPSLAFRRSLFAVQDIAKGERITHDNVRSIRPGDGLPPHELPLVLGRVATRAIRKGTPLSWDLVGGP